MARTTAGPITNEVEAWEVLGLLIELGEHLPRDEEGFPVQPLGLCYVIDDARSIGLLGDDLALVMTNRIDRSILVGLWLPGCPSGAWKPRVAWCYRFADEAARGLKGGQP